MVKGLALPGDLLPGFSGVATFATYREHAGVHIRFRMAAFAGSADVFGIRGMTVSARDLAVAFFQWKISGGMIKFLQGKGRH